MNTEQMLDESDAPPTVADYAEPGPVVLDARTRLWGGARFCTGGSPWRMVRLSAVAGDFMTRVAASGSRGVLPASADQAAVRTFVERGIVHPVRSPRPGAHDVQVVVPVHGGPELLARTLAGLAGTEVVVVDDASPDGSAIRDVAARYGAAYLRLDVNVGPAAARNAGAGATTSTLVAFVDADCVPPPGWLDALVPHFDDPRVGAVAPRILPISGSQSALARYEESDSSLDMGRDAALVRPGAVLGFVPSATLVVRAAALPRGGFDEALRLGEDVDLVWRISDAGWLVRYDPSVVVGHELRGAWREWAARRFDYGTSAAQLEQRHPGRLTPIRVSSWNAGALVLAALGRPGAAAAAVTTGAGLQARRLRGDGVPWLVAVSLAMRIAADDAASVGRVLRREYWPVGAVAMAATPWSRRARIATGLMLVPVVTGWLRGPRRLDPVRYAVIRSVADAAYGTGVQAGAMRGGSFAALRPRLRQRAPAGDAWAQRLRRLRGSVT